MDDESRILAHEYADYLRLNLTPGAKAVHDAIDETLTRLDEYSGLIDMVHADNSVEICTSVLRNKDELESIFEKVRKLELMVHRIKQDVDKAEELVNTAETELGFSTEGKLRNILRPFFKRSNTVPPPSSRRNQKKTFAPPDFFKTKDFFET